ncbi:MAG: hypothetical protein EOM31_03555 [Bacteroidia bacterium]|nr:hypothetical protein [Bacteroidia bacterium]
MKTKVSLAVLAFMAMTTIGLAQNTTKSTTNKEPARRACFVDENKNKICDKYENGTCKVGCGTALRDGNGRAQGVRQGKGRHCHAQGCKRQGLRNGSGRANGGRQLHFVDTNKNGVCDRLETTKATDTKK